MVQMMCERASKKTGGDGEQESQLPARRVGSVGVVHCECRIRGMSPSVVRRGSVTLPECAVFAGCGRILSRYRVTASARWRFRLLWVSSVVSKKSVLMNTLERGEARSYAKRTERPKSSSGQ